MGEFLTFAKIASAQKMFQDTGATGFQSYSVLRAEEKCNRYYKLLSLFTHPILGIKRWFCNRRKYRIYAAQSLPVQMLVPLYLDDKGAWHVAGAAFDLDVIDICAAGGSLNEQQACLGEIVSRMRKDGIRTFSFRELPDDSETNVILRGLAARNLIQLMNARESQRSVKIDFGTDYEMYFSSLGKHARQNLRTAYNRLHRDGKNGAFEFWSSCGLGQDLTSRWGRKVLAECMTVYRRRQLNRYHNSGLVYRLMQTFCDVTTSALPGENGFLTVERIDGRIAGFMVGFIDSRNSGLKVPRLAIEDVFSFYSPGLILLNETVKWLLSNSSLRQIDLCRGTEKYKFDMGGREYCTQCLEVRIL